MKSDLVLNKLISKWDLIKIFFITKILQFQPWISNDVYPGHYFYRVLWSGATLGSADLCQQIHILQTWRLSQTKKSQIFMSQGFVKSEFSKLYW